MGILVLECPEDDREDREDSEDREDRDDREDSEDLRLLSNSLESAMKNL